MLVFTSFWQILPCELVWPQDAGHSFWSCIQTWAIFLGRYTKSSGPQKSDLARAAASRVEGRWSPWLCSEDAVQIIASQKPEECANLGVSRVSFPICRFPTTVPGEFWFMFGLFRKHPSHMVSSTMRPSLHGAPNGLWGSNRPGILRPGSIAW